MPIKNISYWALYLKKYLTEEGDPRNDDDAFIDARAELAAATMDVRKMEQVCAVELGRRTAPRKHQAENRKDQ